MLVFVCNVTATFKLSIRYVFSVGFILHAFIFYLFMYGTFNCPFVVKRPWSDLLHEKALYKFGIIIISTGPHVAPQSNAWLATGL